MFQLGKLASWPKIDINFSINFVLFINSGLTNFAGEKLVQNGFYKPHAIKATLQNLIYVFILTTEKRPRW